MLKRFLSICIVLGLTVSALTGCGKSGTAGAPELANKESGDSSQEPVSMGRYLEKSLELPVFEESESIISMVRDNKGEKLYTFLAESEGSGIYSTYSLLSDGSWGKESSEWLQKALDGKKGNVREIRTGQGDSTYAWYFDGAYRSHIIKTTDGAEAEEIKLTDLEIKENIVNGFAVTGSGDIAISYMNGSLSGYIVLYSAEDGSELLRFKTGDSATDNICDFMDASGDKLVLLNESANGFNVYDTKTGQVLEEIKMEPGENITTLGGIIKIGEEEDYYFLSKEGLGHFQSGGSIIEMIIDGSLNSMGLEGILYQALMIGEDKEYNVLFLDGDRNELAHYEYDSNVPSLPAVQLNMFGLAKNKSVSRAIGAFQKENPDVRINYYTAEGGAGTVSDSIRTLNTELLSGKGADILFLEGLPMESYIEKGVLEDISDIISPMNASGEFMQNMIKSYEQEEGSIYGVPVRFGIPALIGDKEVNEAFTSLDALLQYAENNTGREFVSYNFRTVTYDELAAFILLINYQEIVGDGSRLDKATLQKYLETVMAAGKAIGATEKKMPKPPTTEADLKEQDRYNQENKIIPPEFELGIYPIMVGSTQGIEIKGVADMLEPLTMQKEYGKVISSANGQYLPSGIIGINSSSKQVDRAKEFVKCILSEEEQIKDLGDGLPVNVKALKSFCDTDVNYSMAIGFELNGELIRLNFEPPSSEEIEEFTQLAETLTVPLNIDRVFKEIILDESKPYFEGSITADKAAEAILTKASTYLAE